MSIVVFVVVVIRIDSVAFALSVDYELCRYCNVQAATSDD